MSGNVQAAAKYRTFSCSVCDDLLPLIVTSDVAARERWECVRCGAAYVAQFDPYSPPSIHRNARKQSVSTSGKTSGVLDNFPIPPLGVAKNALPHRQHVDRPNGTTFTRLLDAQAERYRDLSAEIQGEPWRDRIVLPGTTFYSETSWQALQSLHTRCASHVEHLFQQLATSSTSDLSMMQGIAKETLGSASQDLDIFVAHGIQPTSQSYPSRHSYQVAMLSMSMGIALGYDQEALHALGLGCLLHDIGMLCLDRPVHQRPDRLDNAAFSIIAKHPMRTFALLEKEMNKIPIASRMVAYQLHERCDGSGYPRGRKKDQIHELARVAMIADVYLALISPRAFRPALQPHSAVKHILYGVRDGLFDNDAARALLATVSLFPIGSYVRLSDARVAQVLRAYQQPMDRPIVATNLGIAGESPELIDLAQAPDLRITGTVESLVASGAELQPA
jgi:HD-GYP domain-containing protein (c-di-GMP phosphodiesterase class II)